MIGQTISHYKILSKLGEGGMGVVYKAEDLKLNRFVALKFLPPSVSDDQTRKRFVHEAQAASSLEHPNICSIHEIDETPDGQMFIVMPCYEGESLAVKIEHGPLKLEEAVEIVIQVATGLSKAHEKEIVHRDIKPGNILMTSDGLAKIVDFGLAKLSGRSKLTRTGTSPGTVSYMSPEQLKGGDVDHRSDIWALGVVLYEMITGDMPFRGDYEQAMSYSIVNEAPKPIRSLRPDAPLEIERLIEKTLSKDPNDRYQRSTELIDSLQSLKRRSASSSVEAVEAGRTDVREIPAIVVLPFENLSPDPENAFFADGLTEELITDLSKVRALRVISRTSAMLLKGSQKDVPTIARELNVGYALEGSVRRAGSSLRITAQLIDAANDTHLWAEKYGGTLDDVFAIQEKVSRSIVDALKLQLTPEEAERLSERPIPNVLAFEFYLKARQEILKWTEAGLENALRYLQTGLEIAGPNAVLFAGVAYVHVQYSNLGLRDFDECRREAENCLDQAFALDPDCQQGHFVLGVLRFPDSPREAIRHLKRVLEVTPDDFDALYFISCLLGSLGQSRVVIPLEERAARLDPLNPAAHFHLGFNRIWEGKFGQAREVLQKLNREFPADPTIKFAYGLSLTYLREEEHACVVFDELAREQPGTIFSGLGLSLKYVFEGKRAEALRCLDARSLMPSRRDFQYACWVAECYALLDEREKALDWLERDVELGMINYPYLSEYDPLLANLRSEPRFQQLMARVKKEWERFEV